ncbi:hypothetical protein ElyMa_005334500 [Elysia marginata]|uniref:Reverse transcriptase domain-containing protein n=1 Tax=Elysia marginata TaxID=1093978 RepID=A0AAV4K0T2_9GAST|nr:hypothetical protein ElyMa_005334500 [Elysia marginata]
MGENNTEPSTYQEIYSINNGKKDPTVKEIQLDNKIVKFQPDTAAKAIFRKARHPPYTLRRKIEDELHRLEQGNIIEKTDTTEWGTPIFAVPKSDGSFCICGDYKTTLNKEVKGYEHPIPRLEDLAAKLAGGEKFSSIDFSHAYTHLCLDEESQNLTIINTHCGLYKYKCQAYGISACPAIWQRTIESISGDILSTVVYFDNMFITGADTATHLKTLETIFKRCKEKGLTLKRT